MFLPGANEPTVRPSIPPLASNQSNTRPIATSLVTSGAGRIGIDGRALVQPDVDRGVAGGGRRRRHVARHRHDIAGIARVERPSSFARGVPDDSHPRAQEALVRDDSAAAILRAVLVPSHAEIEADAVADTPAVVEKQRVHPEVRAEARLLHGRVPDLRGIRHELRKHRRAVGAPDRTGALNPVVAAAGVGVLQNLVVEAVVAEDEVVRARRARRQEVGTLGDEVVVVARSRRRRRCRTSDSSSARSSSCPRAACR